MHSQDNWVNKKKPSIHVVSRFLLTQLSYECINNVFLVFSSSHSVLENLIDTDNFLILNMGVRITEVISQPCSNYVLFFFGLGIIKNKEAFEKHPALISFSFYCWKKSINHCSGVGLFRSCHWWGKLASFFVYTTLLIFVVWLGNCL